MQKQLGLCTHLGSAYATAAEVLFRACSSIRNSSFDLIQGFLSSIPAAEAEHKRYSQLLPGFTFQACQPRVRRLLTKRLRAEPSLALRWWR